MITLLLIIILDLKHTIYDPAAVRGMKLKRYNLLVSRGKSQSTLSEVPRILILLFMANSVLSYFSECTSSKPFVTNFSC